MVGAVVSALSNAANIASNLYINRRNEQFTRETNREMMDFSKNAVSYNVADRLRAGLSPVDAGSSEVPALTAPEDDAPKISGLDSAVNEALSLRESKRVNDSVIAANNAKAESDLQDANTKAINNIVSADTILDKIAALRADYQNTFDKGSKEATLMDKRLEELEAAITNIKADTSLKGSQTSLNNALSAESKERANSIREDVVRKVYDTNWFKNLNLPTSTSMATNAWTTEAYRFSKSFGDLVDSIPEADTSVPGLPGDGSFKDFLKYTFSGQWFYDILKSAKDAGISGASNLKKFISEAIEQELSRAF